MSIIVSTQNVHTWKKIIQKPGLKGSTYFCQQKSGKVWVSASADHQSICQKVLGPQTGKSALESYKRWDNVKAVDLVELLYQIDNSN